MNSRQKGVRVGISMRVSHVLAMWRHSFAITFSEAGNYYTNDKRQKIIQGGSQVSWLLLLILDRRNSRPVWATK